ncbi:MAG: hydrogenase iron-sulfur subunit [Methanomassiliicoccales archaeon]|nr:MAG: hydrogenase iron-sulfur subunit [Methanomassiliicoccales archaeon]
MPDKKIGVFICGCGGNISKTVDVKRLKDDVETMEGVVFMEVAQFTCSKLNLESIKKAISEHKLEGIVVAACSPHMHETLFKNVAQEAGLNPYLVEHVNLREQCSWIHEDMKKGTEKALDLIRAGVLRARELEALESTKVDINKNILIIGGGIAGITSALQLAGCGYHVTLLERYPSIGGHMAQLSKTYPTLDCSPCILAPKMADLSIHPDITLITCSEVVKVEGSPGNFQVKVSQKPRGVDTDLCLCCGKCSEECPVEVEHEFDEGLYIRKAIDKPFPQAVPPSYFIDFDNCSECGSCVEACPVEAINLEDEEKVSNLDVGIIIAATGFELLDPSSLAEYHFEHPDVISAMQMERLFINEAAEGKVLKRKSDGKRVKRIAYLLCVGSRDTNRGVAHCCKVGCTYAIKHSVQLREYFRYMDVWVYYLDIRASTRGCEEFYMRAQEEYKVNFVKSRGAEVVPSENGLIVRAEDVTAGEILDNEFDLVVLCPAILPARDTEDLAKVLKIPLGPDGFIAEKHPKLDPVSSHRTGIFAAGCILGPKDIHESVTDANSAVAKAIEFIGDGTMVIDPIKAFIIPEKCTKCGKCVPVCPVSAITIEPEAILDSYACIGCGACIPECEFKALDMNHYTEAQIMAEITGILQDKKVGEEPIILGFFGDKLAYTAADSAGTARMSYPPEIRIIRVPSAARIALKHIIFAFSKGADGVLLSDEEGGELSEVIEKRLKEYQSDMDDLGIEKDRLQFMPMLLPTFKVMPKMIDMFVKKIRRKGRIDKVKRDEVWEIFSKAS